jgi:hypothetical protein
LNNSRLGKPTLFRYAKGTFTGIVRAYAVVGRNRRGRCNEQPDALLDAAPGRGTLSC